MSQYSKFPAIHLFLESIPFFGISWHEVLTSFPSSDHLHWPLVFAAISAIIQFLSFILTKTFAPKMIGYSTSPPLPRKFEKLEEVMKINMQHIDFKKYDIHHLKKISEKSKLSTEEISKYLSLQDKHRAEVNKNEHRFQECVFAIACKSLTLGLGFYAIYDKDWLYDPMLFFFDGWPVGHGLDCCVPDLKFLYLAHIGWYVYKIFGQIFLERHLKDFWASMTHHVTTIALMASSYTNANLRGGTVVLLLHDPADLALHVGKFLKLINQPILMNIAFGTLVIVWFATRIVLFPLHIIWPTIVAYRQLKDEDIVPASRSWLLWMDGMCVILYCLHLHWFRLILQIALRTLRGEKLKDSRSDKDEDDESSEDKDA